MHRGGLPSWRSLVPTTPTPSNPTASKSAENVPLADKVRFLSSAKAFGRSTGSVSVSETHMSFVFICGDRVLKLKKPVRHAFLDFSTIAARRINCEHEVSLNRRLAPDVYLGIKALLQEDDGNFHIDGKGTVVDWLVCMRRLPANSMLDQILLTGKLLPDQINRLAERLARFYLSAKRPKLSGNTYVERILAEHEINRKILTQRQFQLDHGRLPSILKRMDDALMRARPSFEARAESAELVEGHGDLRPEHICFENGIAIFDCLEFSSDFRIIDPADELAFLGLECAMLGDDAFGPTLIARIFGVMNSAPADMLLQFYQALRAELRARLVLAHLLDPRPREPDKWEPLARRYLAFAEAALGRIEASM
jgi:aminoglycoside phosphotransferase family enzyme